MEKTTLVVGQIMQFNPETVRNKAFAACLFVVTEPKEFGAQGFVQSLGTRESIGGQAYYRATWDEIEPTGGYAEWMPGSSVIEEDNESPNPSP